MFGGQLVSTQTVVKKLSAVIVEDDEDLAQIFALALQDAQFDTEIVCRGDIALERISQTLPDLVVLDMFLPHLSGEQILQQIRANEKLSKTRVIVASAIPQLAEKWRGKVDLVLIKPIGFRQLRDLAGRLGETMSAAVN